jgi:hypothetical protein
MATNQQFLIKKWYFDGVSDDGRTIICYSATMIWRGFKIGYTNYIYLHAPGDCRSKSRFHEASEPEINGAAIRWQEPHLGVKGTWESAAAPVRTKVFESEEGYADWHCYQPAAKCSIQLGNEPPLQGYGYVECLEMTIPPWKMGFNELRWGRFAHPETPLVWIEMRGTPNRCWVFDGTQRVLDAMVSDHEIQLPTQQKTLLLNEPVVIEDKKKILETVESLVRWMPGIDRFTPMRFLQAQETKWRSAGVLQETGQPERTGWAIHELVKF